MHKARAETICVQKVFCLSLRYDENLCLKSAFEILLYYQTSNTCHSHLCFNQRYWHGGTSLPGSCPGAHMFRTGIPRLVFCTGRTVLCSAQRTFTLVKHWHCIFFVLTFLSDHRFKVCGVKQTKCDKGDFLAKLKCLQKKEF